jgi:hypothetical protein
VGLSKTRPEEVLEEQRHKGIRAEMAQRPPPSLFLCTSPELLGRNLREFEICLTFQLVTETKVLQPREVLTRTDDQPQLPDSTNSNRVRLCEMSY